MLAWSEAFERESETPPTQDHPLFIGHTLDAFARDPQRGEVLVIDTPQGAAGYVILARFWSNEHRGETVMLDEFYIDPAHRGGLGAPVLAAVEAHAVGLGCAVIVLEVLDNNPRAEALYLRAGFVRDRGAYHKRLIG